MTNKEYSKEPNTIAEMNYQKYKNEKEKTRKNIRGAIELIRETGDRWYNRVYSTLLCFFIAFFAVVFISFVIFTILCINTGSNFIPSVILAVFSILGFVDFVVPKFRHVQRFCRLMAEKVSDHIKDTRRGEYEPLAEDVLIE